MLLTCRHLSTFRLHSAALEDVPSLHLFRQLALFVLAVGVPTNSYPFACPMAWPWLAVLPAAVCRLPGRGGRKALPDFCPHP